jgi:hypothetical protein
VTYESEAVETAVLRAEIATLRERIADLEHLARTHGTQGLTGARAGVAALRAELTQAVGQKVLSAVSRTFRLIDIELAAVQRIFEQAKCECGLNPDLTVTAEDRAALEGVIEDAYTSHRHGKGKVIDLGMRRRHRDLLSIPDPGGVA